MSSKSEVDLCGIAWPVCLLKFKHALNDLCSCDVLEVLTQDPDVAENITMIVNRSEDTLINQQKEGDVYRLSVEKRAETNI
jgi:TusA-related sulfurtransferase